MVSINTNISSLIVQSSLNKSTSNLETALERLSTGFRINHAKDDAAGYSIASNLTTKINSYLVAEDNILSGIDLLTTASETLELMTNQILRLRDIATQAQNGTYDTQSIAALNLEAENIIEELERLRTSTEYNGINLFESTSQTTPTPPVTEIRTVGIEKESTNEITVTETQTAVGSTTLGTFLNFDTLKEIDIKDSAGSIIATESFDDNNTINDLLTFARRNGLNASITDGVITINSTTGLYLEDRTSNGVLDALGIGYSPNTTVTTTIGTSTTSDSDVTYGNTKLAERTDTIGSVINFSGTQTISVKNQNGAEQGTYGITQSTTFDDLFTFLNQHGISGDITNGVITLTSSSNYVEGSILTQLGIGTDEDVTSQTVVTNATSGKITYTRITTSTDVDTEYQYRIATESDSFIEAEPGGNIERSRIFLIKQTGETVTISDTYNGDNVNITYGDVVDYMNDLGLNAYMQEGKIYFDGDVYKAIGYYYYDNTADGLTSTPRHDFYYDGSISLGMAGYREYNQVCIGTLTITTTTTTTSTRTATASTRFSTLGINGTYTIKADDGTSVTLRSSSTLQNLLSFFNTYSASHGEGNNTFSGGSFRLTDSVALAIANGSMSMNSTLKNVLGLNNISVSTTSVTTKSNTTDGRTHSSGTSSTVETNTTLSELGITNTQYITVSQNGTREVITFHTSDTADDILTSLNNYGITASLSNGRFTFTGNTNSYIVDMSSDLETILNISTPYYTTNTTQLNSNTPSNKLTYTQTNPITASTTLSQLGINTTQSVVVTRNDTDTRIDLDPNATLSTLITELRRNGLTATVSNGKFHLNASDNAYINTMDSILQNALKLSAPFSDQKEVTVTPGLGGGGVHEITIQVGIDGTENSRITVDTAFSFQNLQSVLDNGIESPDVIEKIDALLNEALKKQTELGAVLNRLESAYDSASINRIQLTSSLSTIKDADIAEESTAYLRNQILQTASATLLSTANQTSNVALSLINGLG